jgi:hypothetical protein
MMRLMLVDSHYDRAANAIFRPIPVGDDNDWVGWDVIVDGDEEHSLLIYMVPDLNSDPPAVNVYVGGFADPEQDRHAARIVVST